MQQNGSKKWRSWRKQNAAYGGWARANDGGTMPPLKGRIVRLEEAAANGRQNQSVHDGHWRL